MSLDKFVQDIIYLRSVYKFSVTCWYRTEARNKLVGGKPGSQHLTGNAFDIVLDDLSEKDSFIRAVSNKGYVAINEVHHIHIQKEVKKK